MKKRHFNITFDLLLSYYLKFLFFFGVIFLKLLSITTLQDLIHSHKWAGEGNEKTYFKGGGNEVKTYISKKNVQ